MDSYAEDSINSNRNEQIGAKIDNENITKVLNSFITEEEKEIEADYKGEICSPAKEASIETNGVIINEVDQLLDDTKTYNTDKSETGMLEGHVLNEDKFETETSEDDKHKSDDNKINDNTSNKVSQFYNLNLVKDEVDKDLVTRKNIHASEDCGVSNDISDNKDLNDDNSNSITDVNDENVSEDSAEYVDELPPSQNLRHVTKVCSNFLS